MRVELGDEDDPIAGEALAHHRPLGRPVHQRGDGEQGHLSTPALLHHLLGTLHTCVGEGVDTASQGIEDVFVPPDDPFGKSGGATGIEHVVVVPRPRSEVALRSACGHGLLVGDGAGRRRLIRAVVDGHDGGQAREVVEQLGHLGAERGLVNDGHEVGVGQQVTQLVLHVAVIDVDPDRPQLEHGPRRLHPFDAVEGIDADVVTRADAAAGQEVGEPVGALFHLGVGPPLVRGHQVLPTPIGVDRRLEKVGEVEGHRLVSRTGFDSRGNCGRGLGRW